LNALQCAEARLTLPHFFADTAFWISLSRSCDQHRRDAVAWQAYLVRTGALIVTTEVLCWEWLHLLYIALKNWPDPYLIENNMAGHPVCVSNFPPNVTLHYTPTYSSWLNLVAASAIALFQENSPAAPGS
jgi:hypothetical protein